ncbi:hypothetical protein KVV02_006357 [Mortierella alpina]|uniref:Uncharacterized protein n=1 Tax=Mortierella alpina TaxID=64518 RepID=A0A9P8D365_MORAP|nr:hypothetical protein KVV02_006357 [Mortierella alpina]
MAALHSPSTLQNPPQTFLDKKPPLLPRQSTSDVLSFTHIIANRLLPGQNVWDFFSPAPSRDLSAEADGQIISPQPLSPISPSFGQFPNANRRPSLAADAILAGQKHETQGMNGRHSTDAASTSHMMMMMSSSLPPSPLTPSSLSNALTTSATATTTNPMPKLQKRRSFAQSLKSSMMSLGQLLSPTSSQSSRVNSPTVRGPPHYNILVLGSDSAPLASTLYKMSSLLPAASKIRHYQEISGFFVAYFRSSGSFSCSSAAPVTMALPCARDHPQEPFLTRQGIDEVKSRRASIQDTDEMMEEVKKKNLLQMETVTTALVNETEKADGIGEVDKPNYTATASLLREEALLSQLKNSPKEQMIARGGSHDSLSSSTSSNSSINSGNSSSSSSSDNSTVNLDLDREEIILSDSDEEGSSKKETESEQEQQQQRLSSESTATAAAVSKPPIVDKLDVNSSAHASLSVHAFSLDTTWPVPRTLAQTFWFPFAHGIIYVVDATRKNDPRGMDHLVNARHFLASLIADPHFKRKDIPVVVFANKAGMDPETCYRVDEIAEILGCEEWENDSAAAGATAGAGASGSGSGPGSGTAARPWCVKSTRSDGEGEGLRESVEWLKSRMGEVWKQ